MTLPPIPTSPNSSLGHLGPYLLQRELGRNREGGRITYLAMHTRTQQAVVLKQFRFVQPEASWSGLKSHEREIEILQAIDHPQVPQYLASFETEDGFCMVQEYKNAPSLAEKTHLTLGHIHQIAVATLTVLADLQQQSTPIIHRDIKPENILVGDDFQIYLIDFGLAKLKHDVVAISSVAAGTPGFMPPEELFNRPLTTAADLYSLGATLIGLLTRKHSTEISELLDDNYRFNFTDYLPSVNHRFIDWLSRMVEPNPRDRFPNAAIALAALEPIDITDLSQPAIKFTTEKSEKSFSSLGVAGVVSLLAIGALMLTSKLPSKMSQVQTKGVSRSAEQYAIELRWFESVKPHCNVLEVTTTLQNNPYPETPVGTGLGASCYALAGKLTLADEAIATLSPSSRPVAAQVLFEISHPVADQGDDESAGPMMELVLKYWPENYMARYHAGMSAYVLAENEKATEHLEIFLATYTQNDGWRQKAVLAIDNIQKGIPADERFKVHH